jgi:hypothetical protein
LPAFALLDQSVFEETIANASAGHQSTTQESSTIQSSAIQTSSSKNKTPRQQAVSVLTEEKERRMTKLDLETENIKQLHYLKMKQEQLNLQAATFNLRRAKAEAKIAEIKLKRMQEEET